MLAVKNKQFKLAIQILALIGKQQNREKCVIIDLNLRDENRNMVWHHIFSNFSSSLEQSVELC